MKTLRHCGILMFFLAVSLLIGSVACAQTTAPPQRETPVMSGTTWQQLNTDEKIAFIWGVGQLAAVERYWASKKGDTDVLGYRFAQGIAGVPMNDIVQRVNRYYESNPDQLDKPVLRVVWETVAKPNIAMQR